MAITQAGLTYPGRDIHRTGAADGARTNGVAHTDAAAARALGWFSLGLGLAEVMAPRAVGRAAGIHRPWTSWALRAMGVRELTSGIGILARPSRPAWMWSRVAGDALDLALLGSAFGLRGSRRARLAGAVGLVGAVTALDVACSRHLTRKARTASSEPAQIHVSIAVQSSPETLYGFWRDLSNMPRFMRYVREVHSIDGRRSHWTAGPAGAPVEWDAEITDERPNELIAWRSMPGSRVQVHGRVQFSPAPNGEGTLVQLQLQAAAPGGGTAIGRLLTSLTRERLKADLRRFRQLMETGEIATTEGQPSGRRSSLVRIFNRAVQP